MSEYHDIKAPKLTDLEYQFIECQGSREVGMILALIDSQGGEREYLISEKTLAKLIETLTDCHEKIKALNKGEEYVVID